MVLYLFLRVLFYKPISAFLAKRREKFENETRQFAEREKQIALKEQQTRQLVEQARELAQKAGEDEMAAAKVRVDQMLEAAQKQAEEILVRSRNEFEEEKRAAREVMRVEAVTLAVQIAEKIIGRDFTDADNKAFVKKCLDTGGGNNEE